MCCDTEGKRGHCSQMSSMERPTDHLYSTSISGVPRPAGRSSMRTVPGCRCGSFLDVDYCYRLLRLPSVVCVSTLAARLGRSIQALCWLQYFLQLCQPCCMTSQVVTDSDFLQTPVRALAPLDPSVLFFIKHSLQMLLIENRVAASPLFHSVSEFSSNVMSECCFGCRILSFT